MFFACRKIGTKNIQGQKASWTFRNFDRVGIYKAPVLAEWQTKENKVENFLFLFFFFNEVKKNQPE